MSHFHGYSLSVLNACTALCLQLLYKSIGPFLPAFTELWCLKAVNRSKRAQNGKTDPIESILTAISPSLSSTCEVMYVRSSLLFGLSQCSQTPQYDPAAHLEGNTRKRENLSTSPLFVLEAGDAFILHTSVPRLQWEHLPSAEASPGTIALI